MKTIYTALVICGLIFSPLAMAQKYVSVSHDTIATSYNGMNFSSEKSLLENLQPYEGFSTIAEFIEANAVSIFDEDFMGTVFVTTNSSFEAEEDTEEDEVDLNLASNRQKILKFHIVPGRLDAHGIKKAVEKGGGTAYFATLQGENLGARLKDGKVVLFDSENNTATIIGSDLYHKHGFFHIIEGLLLPKIE